ncbi:MAG: UPF0158 family protein [Candidatus Rokuibacteriota bacterium]
MTDTPAGVQALYRRMLLAHSGEDRLQMGFSMYSTARAFVVASILEREPQASPGRMREAVFLRFYGRDFDNATCEKILARLAGKRPPRRRVLIDWADLEMALTWRSDEYDYYLDVRTGKVLTHAMWGDGEDGDLSEEQVDEGLAEARLVEVERLPSSAEYGWMVEFAASVQNAHLRELLDVALRGRGAFRRFKDVLAEYPAERERWFRFHDERVREAIREWLADHDITPPTEPPERAR